jgi:ATP-dependent helicase/nuclease subunit A
VTDSDVFSLPLPDAPARATIARDLDVNLLVEAGAGSGKTSELVRRMLALLETGTAEIEQIAAVTFTRKAAAELRERFQAEVEERLAHERSEGREEGLAAERLARALDDIDRAFIGTIHAFCARLLRERPLEIGLDPAFEEMAVEERVAVRRRFWHAYLERSARDSDPVLEELAGAGLRSLSLFGLFEHVVENPDVVFEADDSEPPPPAEVAAVRVELEAIIDHAYELMPEREPEKGWDSLQRKIRTLRFTRDITGWEKPADLYDALALLCKPGPRGHSITQKRWKDAQMAKNACARADEFGVGDTPARRLLSRWYAHRYALAVRLADDASREFAAHRIRMGQLDFQDLLLLTARLLRENPRVRRDLGARYRRLLVDEFQDTDPLQAEIILLLSTEPEDPIGASPSESEEGPDAEGAEADGSTPEWLRADPRPGALFVVGDPKQSIYRFRRADIQLYGIIKERFRDFGAVLELTTNFRSRPAIGDLVNELFNSAEFFPAEETPEQAAFEPLNTRPPERQVPAEGVFVYRLTPEQSNQRSAAQDDASRLASWIRARVEAGERDPGDFMILTRNRARLDVYARALEAHGLPVQVTGAGVGIEDEIRELEVVLQCLIDPSNPVAVVAALVGLFFGVDFERLVAHRLEGGGFDAMRPGDRGHPDVLEGLRILHAWWQAANDEPADIFVTGLVSELGLMPFAAAGELGSLRAGALVYALDAVRSAAMAGRASLPGALAALGAALDLAEAEAPLEPGRTDVVRLMNLHQAKGLEAAVVILADPSGARRRAPDMHVVRDAEGTARGYLRVTEARGGFRGDQVLAVPSGWEEKEEAEGRFNVAEEVRLLYVAVTRAKDELLVARWEEGPDASPWRGLHSWLDERATRLDIASSEPVPRASVEITADEVRHAATEASDSIDELAAPTYAHATVTELAKESRSGAPPPGESPSGPVTSSQGFRGFSWGSAVHGALAAAALAPDPAALRATCRDLLVQHERPIDDHGEPVELVELLDLVADVRGSELWVRAQRAERMLSEVPFAVPGVGSDLGAETPTPGADRERRQLDLFGGAREEEAEDQDGSNADSEGCLQVLEGVIDLAFLEKDGWVIADYKTDIGTDPDFARRRAGYRRQVDMYAEAWARLTGSEVKERVLFFTSQGRLEQW